MSEPSVEGGCQCGAVRYRVAGSPVMAALCHCASCRRAHAAPVVGWAMYGEAQVSLHTGTPAVYESSPGVRRSFCARCGTPISFTADYMPGLVDIPIGSLDEPARVPPTFHYWDDERLPWLHIADAWPRYPEFPPMP
jgi:hypothetical protein